MLVDNLRNVQLAINEALAKRKVPNKTFLTGADVTVVAVTKNHPAEVICEAIAAGLTDIGENRVQEAKHKQETHGKKGRWHLIGHLQSNKVRQAVHLFDVIESVDSEKLLRLIDSEAAAIGKVQDVLLQVNVAAEEQKSGFTYDEYEKAVPLTREFKNIRVRGLMILAPKCDDPEQVRPVFAEGYRLFCELKETLPGVDTLSMGMSGDYAVAVEEGANQVRLGTILFGARDYTLQI